MRIVSPARQEGEIAEGGWRNRRRPSHSHTRVDWSEVRRGAPQGAARAARRNTNAAALCGSFSCHKELIAGFVWSHNTHDGSGTNESMMTCGGTARRKRWKTQEDKMVLLDGIGLLRTAHLVPCMPLQATRPNPEPTPTLAHICDRLSPPDSIAKVLPTQGGTGCRA